MFENQRKQNRQGIFNSYFISWKKLIVLNIAIGQQNPQSPNQTPTPVESMD